MPHATSILIERLELDLRNYRTVPQGDEADAVHSMISLDEKRFWGVTRSLVRNGVLPAENVLVVNSSGGDGYKVLEGNRRVASLKIIHGLIKSDRVTVPEDLAIEITALDQKWKDANRSFPCVVYALKESALADRAVSLIHAKDEEASRLEWSAVAKARHNRDVKKRSEPSLDLLEAFLKSSRSISKEQGELWAADYPLSILEDALPKLSGRIGVANARELANKYPGVNHRAALDKVVKAIGEEQLGFREIRAADDFAVSYGFPALPTASGGGGAGGGAGQSGGAGSGGNTGTSTAKKTSKTKPAKARALSLKDPKAVRRRLKEFEPKGKGREKVVALCDEALSLAIADSPLAFCFLLRSMFEISAKCYCEDHKKDAGAPLTKNADGKDRPLAAILSDIVKHLKAARKDSDFVKAMTGANQELSGKDRILSVTSMNQLVHNPSFSVAPSDVAVMFFRIVPLLEAMND